MLTTRQLQDIENLQKEVEAYDDLQMKRFSCESMGSCFYILNFLKMGREPC